ncbi:hypothetical protein Veis_2918 [Verminephrobacter eiseniae EF01-2]|uniref:Uncharacterized protein n=1 Tax=Verminephrobacter eiseniae (strain EF01-2) TaxID=391735 RepID=A1WLZ7_VEREI|nr:hypothetical protein Veis_2918 [Verminephrobacter eiseniae EF01-2]
MFVMLGFCRRSDTGGPGFPRTPNAADGTLWRQNPRLAAGHGASPDMQQLSGFGTFCHPARMGRFWRNGNGQDADGPPWKTLHIPPPSATAQAPTVRVHARRARPAWADGPGCVLS